MARKNFQQIPVRADRIIVPLMGGDINKRLLQLPRWAGLPAVTPGDFINPAVPSKGHGKIPGHRLGNGRIVSGHKRNLLPSIAVAEPDDCTFGADGVKIVISGTAIFSGCQVDVESRGGSKGHRQAGQIPALHSSACTGGEDPGRRVHAWCHACEFCRHP